MTAYKREQMKEKSQRVRGMREKPILSFQFGEQQINPNSEIIFIPRFFSLLLFSYLSKSIIILWKLKNLFYYFIVVIFAFISVMGAESGRKKGK